MLKKRLPAPQELTQIQRDLALATALSDGWLEMQRGGKNARLGFQQSKNYPNKANFDQFCEILKDFITESPSEKQSMSPFRGDQEPKAFLQLSIRTRAHPEFTRYYKEIVQLVSSSYPFQGSAEPEDQTFSMKKIIPSVSYLKEELTYQTLAFIIAQDGSIKSNQSLGVEIHYDGFSYASNGRLCIALKEKFNILAKPTKETRYGKTAFKTYISGDSWEILKEKVEPLMIEEMKYKIPKSQKRRKEKEISIQNNSLIWYETNKNEPFREDTVNFP